VWLHFEAVLLWVWDLAPDIEEGKSAGSVITGRAIPPSDRDRGRLRLIPVATERLKGEHRRYHAEHLGNVG
jgi:hypothetical protein